MSNLTISAEIITVLYVDYFGRALMLDILSTCNPYRVHSPKIETLMIWFPHLYFHSIPRVWLISENMTL